MNQEMKDIIDKEIEINPNKITIINQSFFNMENMGFKFRDNLNIPRDSKIILLVAAQTCWNSVSTEMALDRDRELMDE